MGQCPVHWQDPREYAENNFTCGGTYEDLYKIFYDA